MLLLGEVSWYSSCVKDPLPQTGKLLSDAIFKEIESKDGGMQADLKVLNKKQIDRVGESSRGKRWYI